MIVLFAGSVEFPERPDDRGSIDVWLLNAMEAAVKLDTEEAFDALNLTWREPICES